MEAILLLERAMSDLGESYAVQSIAFRKQREPQIGTLLAGTVTPPSPLGLQSHTAFTAAFNSAAIRLNWADIETDSGRFSYDNAEEAIEFCSRKECVLSEGR